MRLLLIVCACVTAPGLHSSGRGGAGNITGTGGDIARLEEEEDLERLEHRPKEGVYVA